LKGKGMFFIDDSHNALIAHLAPILA